MPANLENSAVATGLEKVSFHSNPKERQCQIMFKLLHSCAHLTSQQNNVQNSPIQASTICEPKNSRCSRCIQRRQRSQRSNCQHPSDHRKSQGIPKKSAFASLTTLQPLTVWIRDCGKFLKRWENQTTLPVSLEIYMWVKKQQLELDMEQLIGSKLVEDDDTVIDCHPAYLTYMCIM